jgi:beta-glucanase (GH16 family)
VKAKLPRGRGMWPAIWTLGTNIGGKGGVGWPRCGEIDIMEFVGKEPGNVYATLHWFDPEKEDKKTGKKGGHTSSGGHLGAQKPSDDFHVYAIEWFEDRIDWYYDSEKYHTVPLAKTAGDGLDPFRKPHYLLLNLALGGSWGGTIDDAVLPQRYEIDYVRAYQKK